MEIWNLSLQFIIKFTMGAECVRLSPKPNNISYKMNKQSKSLRGSQEVLQFQIAISNLELYCALNDISQVVFKVKGCFELAFQRCDFSIHEKIIKCSKAQNSVFQVNAKDIEFLDFQGTVVQKVSLKMHAVCEGPKNHDHLLKEMKSRIIFNLDISQMIFVNLYCNSFSIQSYELEQGQTDYAYQIMLLSNNEEDRESERKIIPLQATEEVEKNVRKVMSTKKLKQSIIGISLLKIKKLDYGEEYEEISYMHFPFLKLSDSDNACMVTNNTGKSVQKRKARFTEQIKKGPKILGNIELQLICHTSKIYLEQMDCLVYSEDGVKIMSPIEIDPRLTENCQRISKKQIEAIMKQLKNQKKITYSNKVAVQKILKRCSLYLKNFQIEQICKLEEITSIQLVFVDLLLVLGSLITQGEDITNERIWEIIDIIIHRPELSSKCLYLIDKKQTKQQIGIKYYKFLCNVICKIVMCTTVGLEYRELKCTQKFIAYAFFRYPWLQNVLINAIKRENDQILTEQKLMEIGAYPGCRSPTKNLLYDWEQCLFLEIQKSPKYKLIFSEMLEIVEGVPQWAQIIFNREDDELFYGLLIEMWNQGEMYLSCNGKILWEYFPYYGELLGAVLGEMQSNQIIEYSQNFMQCSIKLMSNQKLLNIFVKLLFQKTHLYKIYYVVKALQIIRLYFQTLSKSNKRIPKEFNFNYFYTGITSIFESNHSILLIKVLILLYDYYHIFNVDFKRKLDQFIFKRAFFQIFLHWCGYARKIFYYFLEHRVAVKFRLHQKSVNENNTENNLGFQSIQLMHMYENILYSLEQQQKLCKEVDSNVQVRTKGVLYLKMKEKLKKKIKVQPKTPPHKCSSSYMSQSALSEKNPQILNPRHKRSFAQISSFSDLKMNRKYSVGTTDFINDEASAIISDSHRKYIEIAMKEYREVKNSQNPDKGVHQMLKKYQGSKQTQIS